MVFKNFENSSIYFVILNNNHKTLMGNIFSYKCQVCYKKFKLNKAKLREQDEDAYLTAIHDGTIECLECYHKHPTEKESINRHVLHEIYKHKQNKQLNQHRYFCGNFI